MMPILFPRNKNFPITQSNLFSFWSQRCRLLSLQLPLYMANDIERESSVIISAMYMCLHSHSCPSSLVCFTFASLTRLLNWTVLHCMLPSSAAQAPFPACLPLLLLLQHCSPAFLSVFSTFSLTLAFMLKTRLDH